MRQLSVGEFGRNPVGGAVLAGVAREAGQQRESACSEAGHGRGAPEPRVDDAHESVDAVGRDVDPLESEDRHAQA